MKGDSLASLQPGRQSCPAACWARPQDSAGHQQAIRAVIQMSRVSFEI